MAEDYGKDRDNKTGRFARGNRAASGRGGNKVSTKVKEAIVNFLEANVEKIQESFDTLKPREKLQFISDILPYATPKLQSVESENTSDVLHDIKITWTKPDELPSFANQSNGQHKEGD